MMPAAAEENLPTSQPKKMGWWARRVVMQACLIVYGGCQRRSLGVAQRLRRGWRCGEGNGMIYVHVDVDVAHTSATDDVAEPVYA